MADMVSRIYSGFRGVDFRGNEISLVRSPDSINMWKDYRETESIRTRPGLKALHGLSEPVYGIFFYNDICIVHSGTKLYKAATGGMSVLYSGVKAAKSDSFIYNNLWFFKDGANYLQYDGITIKEVEGYVPTTSIARKPSGGGKIHEDVNLLTGRRINTFLADGESTVFALDAKPIDTSFKPVVKVNDAAVENFTVDYTNGKITFDKAPTVPKTDGQDNVSVEFQKTVKGYADKIKKCTLLQVFDNRVFFSGNPDYPNMLWHCSLNDPTYCSDLDYYNEGQSPTPIRGIVAGNNNLWVFREPSQENTAVFYHTPTIDSEYGKIYPSQHSSISTGCVGRAINFYDDILFFSERGAEGISGDITTEQFAAHRSSMVDRKMLSESDYKDMVLEEWGGYLLVCIGKNIYLADSRATLTNGNHTEYEWFAWQLEKPVRCTMVKDGILYIGSDDGVYTLTDNETDVESWWTTPLDKFKNPNKMKTSNKRGCVVEAEGAEISVYVKTNMDSDFEHIVTVNDVADAFTCRIKRKKWKDIRLKFYSTKRFRLETATLECFVGGYLKNL